VPRSLIDAGLADFIPRPPEPADPADADALPGRDEQTRAEILSVLRARTRRDFSDYRKPTLLRRVRRRMGLAHFDTTGETLKALPRTAAEATALADDLFILVTGFFRDPEAWDPLRKRAEASLRENITGPTRFNRAMMTREDRVVGQRKGPNEPYRPVGEAARYSPDFETEAGDD
jgi:hypothetical protein